MKKFILALMTFAVATFAADIAEVEWSDAVSLSKKGAIFLDVRTPGEVAEGAVTGALTIPLQELEERSKELPKDKKILVYCRSGKRSANATAYLASLGYDVVNVKGGFMAVPPKNVLPHN